MSYRLAAVAGLVLAALPAAAQESPLPELFSDVIDVRVVNIEVVVTDRKGNRIRGLEASDFELRVDGDPVPLDYFTEIDGGRARSASDGSIADVPSVTPDGHVGTSFLVFLDELSAIRRNRDRVLDGLRTDLARLGPADRVAIVVYDGYNVTRVTDWTGSRDEIEDALRQVKERNALGLRRPLGLGTPQDRIQRAVMAATAALRSFAAAPGRKVMLLLAEGWRAPGDLDGRPYWPASWLPDLSVDHLYGPLVHSANLVGYTLYPVDLPGFRPRDPGPIADASIGQSAFWSPFSGASFNRYRSYLRRRGLPEAVLGFHYPDGYFASPNDPEWGEHAVLEFLAHETGGLPMINARRDVAFSEAAADTRSYYWLGFQPQRDENDELHDIDVRVTGRRDLRVRSRESYVDMSKGTEVTMLVEGSLLFGGSPGTESLGMEFGAPEKAGFRKIAVPVTVTIPLDDVTLLPMGDLWMNELELRITVINESGDRSETPVRKIPIVGPAAPQPGQTFVYDTGVVMRKREHRYVAAVYDPVSGAILSASGELGPDTGTGNPKEDAR